MEGSMQKMAGYDCAPQLAPPLPQLRGDAAAPGEERIFPIRLDVPFDCWYKKYDEHRSIAETGALWKARFGAIGSCLESARNVIVWASSILPPGFYAGIQDRNGLP